MWRDIIYVRTDNMYLWWRDIIYVQTDNMYMWRDIAYVQINTVDLVIFAKF